MEKNKKLGDRGITLIALIVTIIVLLILAGVSIAVLTGENGIINRTTEAKKTTEESEVMEKIRLAFLNAQIGKYSGEHSPTDYATFASTMQAELVKTLGTGATVEVNGDDFKVTYNGMIFDVTKTGVVNKVEGISIANTLTLQIVDAGTERETKTPKSLTATLNGISGTVTWSKTDEPVSTEETETVSLSGTTGTTISVTPESAGTATITASCGGKSSTCTVTIESVTTVGVTFNVNGGTFESGENGTRRGVAEEDMDLPTAPTITGGNVFKGWYTAENGGKIVYAKNATVAKFPASDTTVYAQYGPDVATVDEVGDGTSTVWYNDSKNWEVFFKDNGRTYLIYKGADAYASENAPILGTKNWSAIYNNPGNYYATGTLSTPAHLTGYLVDSNYTERFKPATQAGWLNKYMTWLGDGTTNYSDAGNMAFTLFMLDQNVWKYGELAPGSNPNATAYYDPNCADWVIGGPTMEMMVATANTLYTSQTNSCSVTQANGYSKSGLGTNTLPAGSVLNHTTGSNYHYYWLGSPYYNDDYNAWFFDGYNARVASDYGTARGFRPVVCLRSNVSLTKTGATTTTYVLTTQ